MAAVEHTEVERKYDVPADASVPDLTGVGAVARVSEPQELHQDATYFDTGDLRLLRAGVTLRRRTGGTDDGWHAKLPLDQDTRQELRLPLTAADGTVPEELVGSLRAVVRDATLAPVAVL